MTGPTRPILATALVLVMLGAACGGDLEPPGTGTEADEPAETPPETPQVPDAAADEADEAVPDGETVEPDDGDEVEDEAPDTDGAVEDEAPDADVAVEDGAVEDGTDLADGRHPTYLHGVDQAGRTLTVDVIQFLTGQAAIDAHDADHPDEPGGPPNDYYIVNVNPRLRTLEVAADVTVSLVRLHEDGDADLGPGTWAELTDYLAVDPPEDDRLSWNPYWITLEDGIVVAIEEQYLP